MRAIICDGFGGAEVLTCVDVEKPKISDDEILVKTHAAGLNRLDLVQRKGKYPPPEGVTDILGLEVSGIIEAIGKNVSEFKVGDAVCGLMAGGGYAEYAVLHKGLCFLINDVSQLNAYAGIPEALFTVWHNVFQRGRLKSGETLLVHGGSSGIGSMAITIAKKMGVKVVVTVGSQEKEEYCEALGADLVINYNEKEFWKVIAEKLQGVDVILDMVGGDYTEKNIECLNEEGRLVQIAFLQGANVKVSLPLIMRKRLTLTGSTMRSRPTTDKSLIAEDIRKKLLKKIKLEELVPHIYETFPLEEAGQAHQIMEDFQHFGKIILTCE